MKKILLMVSVLTITLMAICHAQLFTYIGNSNTGKFHASTCYMIDRMKPEHKVPLNSREEAINQGYVPCGKCRP